jgi:TonB family protein
MASLGIHAVFVVGIGWLAFHSLRDSRPPAPPPPPSTDRAIVIDLPAFAEGTLIEEGALDPAGEEPKQSGGTTVPRLDTGKLGHGGDATVDKPAVHMSDVDEHMRLSPDLLSRLDRDQVHRIESARERASREDRRSTTHPAELTFLASGEGTRAERRQPTDADPSRGVMVASPASVLGGSLGTPDPLGDDGQRADVGGSQLGTTESSPGIGVHDGHPGADHRAKAAVMTARPDVTLGPIAVQALRKNRPNDDVDTDQEVATTVRSLVHASTAGGLAGDGRGGTGGGGEPGAGGSAQGGSHPLPLGNGEGDWLDLNSTDPRLIPYFRGIHAKVDPLWANAFPKSAMLELRQGTVILEFSIAADGTAKVSWPPVRPSGIDEFDRNCANAIRKASPFDPIPRELGRAGLHVRAPFVAINPIVK